MAWLGGSANHLATAYAAQASRRINRSTVKLATAMPSRDICFV
jgi:hypothetical protein